MSERFQQRRERVRRQLQKDGLEGLLVTNTLNVKYLSGFTGDSSYLFIHKKGEFILSDARYTIQIGEECPGLETHIRSVSETMVAACKKHLKPFTGKKIGYEADSLSVSACESLRAGVDRCEWAGTSGIVEKLREIKDREEVAAISDSIRSAYRAWEVIRASLSSEQTEIEIRNELEYRMRKFGSSEKAFDSIVAVGERAALPHAVPTLKTVGETELLLIDWGATFDGYVSDLTRTLITKSPSNKLRKVYETVLAAQKAAIAAIAPGVKAADIHNIAHGIIADAGFGKYFTHGLGHGIGLFIHESIRLGPKQETELKPGMVLTVEPGIYLPGWGGVRIEDDILVKKNGCEILSDYVPREFEEMFVRI